MTDSVQLIPDKFHEYERDRKTKDGLITNLQTQATDLIVKISNLSVLDDTQEQYFWRNCLLIHGVEENRNEETDILSISIINEYLGRDIQLSDIGWTDLIGNKHTARKKGQAMIIKFTKYNIRRFFSWIK